MPQRDPVNFNELLEQLFGRFTSVENDNSARNADAANSNTVAQNPDLYYQQTEREQRDYERKWRENERSYERQRDAVQQSFEREVMKRDQAYEEKNDSVERRMFAVEAALEALGPNTLHAGEPLKTAREILSFIEGGK